MYSSTYQYTVRLRALGESAKEKKMYTDALKYVVTYILRLKILKSYGKTI